MSYFKTTGITGRDAGGVFHAFSVRAHLTPERSLAYARKRGLTEEIKIEHRVSDLSGKGYGGIDAQWKIKGDMIVPVAIGQDEQDDAAIADAGAVHDLWDEIEGRS